ncbi:cysteine-rich KTR domain-containing protein [Agathobaculum sp.]|uniref:cysteine-rich KTR domain-containing protein n=1 Tax=Agathobaculum TaxID=2048137 RepID=UPI003AB680F4
MNTIGTWEWFLCPFCSKKLAKVSNQTKVYNFLIYCRHCKREVLVNWHGKTQ